MKFKGMQTAAFFFLYSLWMAGCEGLEVKELEQDNEISLPWKHIVERVKLAREKEKDTLKEEEKRVSETNREALRFLNTFLTKYLDGNISHENIPKPSYQQIDRIEQLEDLDEGPLVTIRHSLTVNNKTEHGVTIMHADSLDQLVATGLQLLFSSGLEKSSSLASLSTVLPYIAPFLLILSPLLLLGLMPTMFFTTLFIIFGFLSLIFLLPFILPLVGIMSAFFMEDDFFADEDFSNKNDILQPFYKEVTEAATTTLAEIVTNIPRMFH